MSGQETAPTVETRRIEDIIIGDRFRKDLGDIDSLIQSIDETGLLSPAGITPDNILIYGLRRIEAYKRSGRTEIPVVIIPLEDIIKGELIENTARKDFTFSERQAILEEIESRRIGHRVSKEKVSNLQTFQKDNKGKASVNIVADYTGVSPRQLSKEKAIAQKAKQNPQLKRIIEKLDNGEISVKEAEKEIEFDEYIDAKEQKKANWRELREQIMKEDNYQCRICGDKSHLDVYPESDDFQDKYTPENLQTLCKECHRIETKFFGEYGLVDAFVLMFQKLTGLSGKRYFQYSIGDLNSKDRSSSFLEELQKNPHSRLKRSSYDELVSKTRSRREVLIQTLPLGDHSVYITQDVLSQLLPVLRDYQQLIDKEADARRRRKAAMEGT